LERQQRLRESLPPKPWIAILNGGERLAQGCSRGIDRPSSRIAHLKDFALCNRAFSLDIDAVNFS